MSDSFSFASGKKRKWFENFARYGLISKGIVYCLFGILSSMAAFGLRGDEADKTEAFGVIYNQPFGKVLLMIIAVGLCGYVTLRIFQSFKDINHKGNNAVGIITRIGYGISAMIYISLAVYAVKLVFEGHGDSGSSRQFIVSKALEFSGGRWLVAIAGLIMIGSGVQQIVKGVTGSFFERMKLIRSGPAKILKKAGIIGYISRGVVLGIIGYLFLLSAWASNPQKAQGTDGAFNFLENNFGSFLMGAVALGMVGYGIFMFIQARYQQIDIA
jgi:hypothetical protein